MKTTLKALLSLGLIVASGPLFAEDVLSVAVFNFETSDEGLKDLGSKVSILLNAELSANPMIMTVERAELEKALGEQEMGLSGTIQPETAARVGHLTGAKVLITGRAFKVENELILVAKIISSETSRVYGEVARGPASTSIAVLSIELAKKIGQTLQQKAATLIAEVETPEERIEKIRKTVKDGPLPSIEINIPERHFGGPTIDPAAQTELGFILQKCGFTVVDSKSKTKSDLALTGEALSELGMRKGNLVSCKGRIELKLTSRSDGKVLLIDRQTSVAVDLSEQIAAKAALQRAAQELAARVVAVAGK